MCSGSVPKHVDNRVGLVNLHLHVVVHGTHGSKVANNSVLTSTCRAWPVPAVNLLSRRPLRHPERVIG